ncbi:MAG: VWA domain-containing protein [bacterium]|nr:VWA domain-containing protein [bacterium]
MKSSICLRTLPWVFATVLVVFATAAQPQSDSIFVDRVDVNVVNVEVFVTDKDGRRVTGLDPDDFEIFEDGRSVEISNFYSVARDDRVTEDLARDRELLRSRRSSLPRRQELPEDQQLNLLVYVDHFNLHQSSQKRVLDDLEVFLEDRVTQGDNIMLVGYNRKVNVVQNFTRDRQKLEDGLLKLRKVATSGQIDDAERIRTMRLMFPGPQTFTGNSARLPGDDESAAYQLLRSYVQKVRSDLRFSTSALESVARSLAGLPGRKAILYVSDGLPKRPGESLYQHFRDIYGNSLPSSSTLTIDPMVEAIVENEAHLMNQIVRQANAHQITFYTLYARGTGNDTRSAEFIDISASSGGRATLDIMRTMNLQEPLIDMAEATGGSSILNTFNFDRAFADLSADFDSFYSLGYRSHHGGDGKYHKIEVRVKRSDLKVRHRTGFVDKPEVERVADRTLSSLILKLEKNPLGINIDFGHPEKKSSRTYLVPVMIRIPFREITLLPNGEVEQGQLRIFLAVQDEEGGISKTHEFPYPLTVPRDQVAAARDREIGYSTTLKIRRGVPKIAVGVWDELSGTESFVHKSLLVGERESKSTRRGP